MEIITKEMHLRNAIRGKKRSRDRIMALWELGFTQSEIAQYLWLHRQQVHQVVTGKTYKRPLGT